MTTDRWDPFREMVTFREAMDRWLQQSISGTGQLLSNIRPESIPIDAIERDDAFEVRAALPGVRPEDVEVTVQGERVTIRAEARGAAGDPPAESWLMREHRSGLLQRSITLPAPVSSEKAEARIDWVTDAQEALWAVGKQYGLRLDAAILKELQDGMPDIPGMGIEIRRAGREEKQRDHQHTGSADQDFSICQRSCKP